MNSNLKSTIANLPQAPGVYIFKDAAGKILYIGKAKNLKKRVQSYFTRQLDSKTQIMVCKIAGLDYKLTSSEAQAQILEASLVKREQPQYNIDLKDDKSFPWIKISDEEFPVVSICRRKRKKKNDTALYFGPYTNVGLLRQAFKLMRRVFGFRSCRRLPKTICLYGRIKLCPAPCTHKVSATQYKAIIHQIKMFLDSRQEELVGVLSSQMQEAAEEKNFEEAARIRDQIDALGALGENKGIFNCRPELEDLKNLLKLKNLPLRIEAFDISNISGKEATGSLVSFYKGSPDKNNYRRFRIKTVEEIDDYAMLAEVVRRRYSRILAEKIDLPDLILIDGGKAHLATAQKELENLGLKPALASIAKEKENIYICAQRTPLRPKEGRAALNLIRRVRDEAHRFARSYHHLLRRKKIIGR